MRAGAALDVAGAVVATAPRLEVRVVVSNHGDGPAAPLDVVGELLGERREARLASVGPGEKGSVVLDFGARSARPGIHALTLLLEHPVEGAPDAAGNPPMASQRAWLLLALGANPGPAVRLEAPDLRLDVRGAVDVRLASADGQTHRVRLRALTARGLRAEGDAVEVEVPAAGAASASLPIVRAGAARGSRHALLLVAETEDGPLARTAVATATVDVAPMPGLVPRLHGPLLAAGLLLLAAALGFEAWRALRVPRST